MSRGDRPGRRVMVALLAVVLGACGGSPRGEPVATGGDTATPAVGAGASRGRAGLEARCDYGGAADTTCAGGLTCCYAPPEDPEGWGHCRPSCP